MHLPGALLLSLVGVVAVGCGEGEDSGLSGGSGGAQRYEVSATVLEDGVGGPELCIGGVAESYPPQCDGPPLDGWDWGDVGDEERAAGTIWGEYHVVGTWDGKRFTLTESAGPAQRSERGESAFTTPCPTPPGGWQVVDAATTTTDRQSQALSYAHQQPSFAGAWLDQSPSPALPGEPGDADEAKMNDPAKLVLNLRFTADLERHEAELRGLWGGALCVSTAEKTLAELRSIQDSVREDVEAAGGTWLSSDVREREGVVRVGVIVADPSLQADLDVRYGTGFVRLVGALRPVG